MNPNPIDISGARERFNREVRKAVKQHDTKLMLDPFQSGIRSLLETRASFKAIAAMLNSSGVNVRASAVKDYCQQLHHIRADSPAGKPEAKKDGPGGGRPSAPATHSASSKPAGSKPDSGPAAGTGRDTPTLL